MEKPLPAIPAKRYFTIGEVSELCGVKPYVLRYWEQEFTQLKPMKRRGNRRYYQHHEVLLIRRIRELLYDQGFTISGARNQLGEPGRGSADALSELPALPAAARRRAAAAAALAGATGALAQAPEGPGEDEAALADAHTDAQTDAIGFGPGALAGAGGGGLRTAGGDAVADDRADAVAGGVLVAGMLVAEPLPVPEVTEWLPAQLRAELLSIRELLVV